VGCSCRYNRGGPVRRRSPTSTPNFFLTILQRRLECEVRTSQGTLSLTRLQPLYQLHHASSKVADMQHRYCNEPLRTIAETSHSPLRPWNQPSNTSPQFPNWNARHISSPQVRTLDLTSALVQQQATNESTDGIPRYASTPVDVLI